ncbi:MAG: hypothetical protein EAZ95_11285 [Bacteroidetes bacterium]|nr:MAG: hypothetical protein EAZ95_11285 [Bacteroidota bacterium]
MLKLIDKTLPTKAQDRLQKLQSKVNAKTTFKERTKKVSDLWEDKTETDIDKETFSTIKTTLTTMCVGVGLCNYCEQNEASDIEHILPKSLFPEEAFVWENYLLACKHCNTTYKSDKIDIFNPAQSHQTERVERGTEPPAKEIAFIHLRKENPLDFLELDLDDCRFYPKAKPNTREFAKAVCTLDILQLDERDTLVRYRESAFKDFANRFEEIVRVGKAQSFEEIEAITKAKPALDKTLPFVDSREKLLEQLKKDFKEQEHPTVWLEMIQQKAKLSLSLQKLFDENPVLLLELTP